METGEKNMVCIFSSIVTPHCTRRTIEYLLISFRLKALHGWTCVGTKEEWRVPVILSIDWHFVFDAYYTSPRLLFGISASLVFKASPGLRLSSLPCGEDLLIRCIYLRNLVLFCYG